MNGVDKKFDLVGFIIDVENGEVDQDVLVDGVQRMIDSGVVWQLQGSWGRLAANLIDAGLCVNRSVP